ncbi:MAG TPA: MFS transporter [Burkholderiaceae bacterium]|nr:MFS transporter [Burkholderiaceae bacterium]
MTDPRQRAKIIGLLGCTQIISWGTLYYAFAILGPEIQRETGWRTELVFGAFSWCILVAGLVAAPAGMLLDRFGGRSMMGLGSLLCGAGFLLLGTADTIALYFIAWSVLGVAMALVLYEAAFATINREFVQGARSAISTLALFGGLASTVFWPLTLKLNGWLGWRDTYWLYGLLQLALCAPLHLLLTPGRRLPPVPQHSAARAAAGFTLKQALRDPAFWKLAFAFAANTFIFSALSVHLIPLLQQFGHPIASVVLLATLIGPMQVAGRIGEMAFARRVSPQTVGKLTFAALPAALLALVLCGERQWAAAAFCALYGLSNGVLTIVRGTIPQTLYGRANYGAIAGALAGPSLLAKAAGPLAIAAAMQGKQSPYPILALLLLFSLASLGFYLAAIRSRSGIAAKVTPA